MDKAGDENRFRMADSLYRDGCYQDAFAVLQSLAAAYPLDANIQFARARCLAKLGALVDAAAICEELVAQHDHKRAARLLEKLRANDGLPALPDDDVVKVSTVPTANPMAHAKRASVLFAIAVAGALLTAILLFPLFYQRPAKKAKDREKPERKSIAALAGIEVPVRSAAPQSHEAGSMWVTHAEEEWRQTAINDLPDWQPGIYRRVPCVRNGKWTIDVFVPQAYTLLPNKYFPVLIIQMADGKGAFQGLEYWAEGNHVVLVNLNESKNRVPNHLKQNAIAQDLALETLVLCMRVDQRMGFAMGMSGGGKSSWHMVSRYSENFRGLIMMGMSDDDYSSYIPPHVRIAYIHGETDFNNKWIAKKIPEVVANGNEVRERVIPGGHVAAPTRELIPMLDWMLTSARRDLSLPHP